MSYQKNIKCTLIKLKSRGSRISFTFFNSDCKNPPMRTARIVIGNGKKILFEIYSFKFLDFVPSFKDISNLELCNLFKEKSKGRKFISEVKPSQCNRDIGTQSIQERY